MPRREGYAIMSTQPSTFTWHIDTGFVQENRRHFEALRTATSFIDPISYRGISRAPLSPLPSAYPEIIAAYNMSADAMEINRAVRARFWEILDGVTSDADDDEDLLPTLKYSCDVYHLLEVKADYEIVVLHREPFNSHLQTLGFDIRYWGGNHFSLIADTVVMPT